MAGIVESHIGITFGLVLAAALLAGMLADFLSLPKVTGYLLVGVVLGPSACNLLAEEHVHLLEPLTKLAIGLVLFNLGCHFPLTQVRQVLKRLIRLSSGELSATFLLVTLGLVLHGQSWPIALMLGALALATAPATTVLVLKETESEGPLTESVGGLVIVNNVASIVCFEFVFLAIHVVHGQFETPFHVQVALVLQDLIGSVTLGMIAGLLVSYACGLTATGRWLVLLVAATTFLLGVAEVFHYPYMLSFLAMGLTVASSSDQAVKMDQHLDRLTNFLCVVFFVIHGAELDLEAFAKVGMVGAIYIGLRITGKYVGIFAAAQACGESPAVRNWLGSSLMAQAGAAIALSSVAVQRDPDLGKPIQAIILGTVVVFEIAGPLLIRLSVLRAGEVPLAKAVHHTSSSAWDELLALWRRILIACGRNPFESVEPNELKVSDLFRKNVPGLLQSSNFDEVIDLIEHSHDNTYAVIDEDSALVGIIRYAELSTVMFNRSVATLVCAEDLASPAQQILFTDESAETAMELFRKSQDDCIPVVTRDEPHCYVGVLRRRDVLQYLVRQNANDTDNAGSGH